MKNRMIYFVAVLLISISACSNNVKNENKTLADLTNKMIVTEIESKKNKSTISIDIDGTTYTFDMSENKSELKFYSEENKLNVDAACHIQNEDGTSSVDVVIEGMGKGKDQYQGKVSLSNTQSLASFNQGDNKFSFVEGNLEIEDFSKTTGMVKLTVVGTGTMQKGNSYTDMKVDVPAKMEIDVSISDIRNFK